MTRRYPFKHAPPGGGLPPPDHVLDGPFPAPGCACVYCNPPTATDDSRLHQLLHENLAQQLEIERLRGVLSEQITETAQLKKLLSGDGDCDFHSEYGEPDAECTCEPIDPDVAAAVDESATVRCLREELSALHDRNDALELELQRQRALYKAMDLDYRRNAEELADMRRPEAREGREAKLLQQIGEQQTQLFEAQRQMRLANVALENIRGLTTGQIAQQKEVAAGLLAAGYAEYKRSAATLGCREEVASRKLLTVSAVDPVPPVVHPSYLAAAAGPMGGEIAKAEQSIPDAYYERLMSDLGQAQAKSGTFDDLKRRLSSIMTDMRRAIGDEE